METRHREPLIEFSPIDDSSKKVAPPANKGDSEEDLMGQDRTQKSLEKEFDEIAQQDNLNAQPVNQTVKREQMSPQ